MASPDSLATPHSPSRSVARYVALTGNPNSGKTTLFNALTGMKAKVGNYAGVTVERKEGILRGGPPELALTVLDLPGTYSLSPKSPDEEIARDVLFGWLPEVPVPAMVVVVIDASNLERNLYYATQVIELGYPTIVVLNMVDVAEENGQILHVDPLALELGVPVVPLVASTGKGIAVLRQQITQLFRSIDAAEAPEADSNSGLCSVLCGAGDACGTGDTRSKATHDAPANSSAARPASGGGMERPLFCDLPETYRREVDSLARQLLEEKCVETSGAARSAALLLLSDANVLPSLEQYCTAAAIRAVREARGRLESAGIDWAGLPIEARYARITTIHAGAATETLAEGETTSDRIDKVLTHKLWGMLVFVGIMAVLFQSIFWIAQYPMGWMEAAINGLGSWVARTLPEGDARSLLVDGVIAGVGGVVVFLPQILTLFFFIGLLEDTGYMARAAFLMDRVMSKVGLHGKSFVPLLSSFACAIPGIMATRTIENPKDRLVTILVAPLMSCSARLPVYTVLIAASIPDIRWLGFVKLAGMTLLCMYLLGIAMALLMAWFFKKTLFRGEPPMLIMELPPYKRPVPAVIVRHMWERSKLFLRRAGTVILGISILLWFLATHPRLPEGGQASASSLDRVGAAQVAQSVASENVGAAQAELAEVEDAGAQLRHSYAGRLGQWIEPFIEPLGFDWKIGIGIIASFAAREVFVSTMSTVYNLGEVEESDQGARVMAETLKAQTWPDGRPVYTPLVCVTLMVFYVFAMQCVSTLAVVRRETNGWKWPVFQFAYMTLLAWVMAFITYRGGLALGFG